MESAFGDGTRRRLPTWMSGNAASNQLMKSGERGESRNKLEVGLTSQVYDSKAKKQPDKSVIPQQKEALKKMSSLSKCETISKKRKSSQKDSVGDNNIPEIVLGDVKFNGKGRRVRESSQRKSKARNGGLGPSANLEIPSPIQDDLDLTAEDLLSIADEYIKADKDIQMQNTSKRECGSVKESMLASLENDSSVCLIASENDQRQPVHDRACNSTVSWESEQNLISTSATGDATHDMLDLFLGPWLKKPVHEKTESITKDIELPCEFGKPSQTDAVPEVVRLKKKSSTLRDKVSVLLD